MSRADQARALAPASPPCFASRDQWVEYVVSCAVDQRIGHAPGPLLFVPGEPVRFNPKFSLCTDCDDRHAGAMGRTGKCKPRFLVDLFAAQTATKEPA